MYTCERTGNGVQKRVMGPLDFHVVVSFLVWLLAVYLGSSVRAERTFNY